MTRHKLLLIHKAAAQAAEGSQQRLPRFQQCRAKSAKGCCSLIIEIHKVVDGDDILECDLRRSLGHGWIGSALHGNRPIMNKQ